MLKSTNNEAVYYVVFVIFFTWALMLTPQYIYFLILFLVYDIFNVLKTKRNLLYIRNHFVPRSKQFPPRYKIQSVNYV